MALEDFFTLSEMKAGLTTPDRVEELINLMKKENEKDVKNVEETSRQWCTVARTIACTDNQECLDRFVQLNGLSFINMWLNDINKCASDSPNNLVEESMIAMLLALEKLHIDDEKLASSGIGTTLRSLIVHTSSLIKDRATMLLDSWKQPLNPSKIDVDTEEDLPIDNRTKPSIKQNESCTTEDVNEVKNVQNVECGNEVDIAAIMDSEAVKKETTDTLHSADSSILKDSISIICSMGADADADPGFTNNGNETPSNSKREAVLGSSEQNIKVLADVEDIQNDKTTILVEQVGDYEHPFTSSLTETEARSNEAKAEEPATEAAQQDSMIVASEIMDNPGPVCSSSQEKIQDDPTEQLSKSFPQEVSPAKESSSRVIQLNGSDSIIVQPEDDSNPAEPSHVNAVVQEAETRTRAGELGFDLNVEVLSEDLDPSVVPSQELKSDKVDHYPINQTSLATFVVSASRASAVPGLLAGGLQFEGTSGWKGSAATSAFRQASPRRPVESDNVTSSNGPSTSSEKKRQHVQDFDLNMADDGNADNTTDSVIAVSSSHHSEESCVEIGPRKSKRVELDLNCVGDAPPSSAFLSNKNGHPFSNQKAYRSPSPASSSSSVHPSMWDVDLNKKLSVPNFPYDPQPYPQNSTFNIIDGHTARKPADSGISIMGARVDVGREQTFQHSPFHPNANITGMRNFFPPSMSNNPPCPPMQSFMYRPGIPITMVDSRGSPVMPPQMISPAQQPYLMNMMATPPNGFLPMPPSFDPNMLYMNNETALAAVNRGEQPYPRQYLMSSQGSFLEPHSTAINAQPTQPSPWVTKRNEPHTGWDPYRHGSKHQESPGKT